MDKEIVELGVAIKEKIQGSKQKLDNFIVGQVVSLSPLTVSIDEAIMLYHYQIYVLESVLPEHGDTVALIPSTNNQIYLLLGKVVSR